MWAVPPGLVDEGGKPQPAYLNFKTALLSSPVGDTAQASFLTNTSSSLPVLCTAVGADAGRLVG